MWECTFLEQNLFSNAARVKFPVSATFHVFSSHINYIYIYSHSHGHIESDGKSSGAQVPSGVYLCMCLHETNTFKDDSLL